MRVVLLFPLMIAACAPVPRLAPEEASGAYPTLVPTSEILAAAEAVPADRGGAVEDELAARAAALRARAAALRAMP